MSGQVLRIEPEDYLRFDGPFTDIVAADIKISNSSDDLVAYKIKTTAPKHYAVKPNSGVLQGGESINVSVMRQPSESGATEMSKHKFMIQSLKVTPDKDLTTIWHDIDPSLIMDTRLKVIFENKAMSTRSSVTVEEFEKMQLDNQRLCDEIDELKEERARLRNLAMASQESRALAEPLRGPALIFLEKKNIFFILVLLILCFIAGVLLADRLEIPANP